MEEYYFLFILAFFVALFASVQDFKKREIANWLNFSFIAIALAYRAFYSYFSKDLMFFTYGLIGLIIFFLLGNLFYYTRIFAGGDAKLMMGFGIILPYSSVFSLIYDSLFFVFLLLFIGAIYGLVYSFFLAFTARDRFGNIFFKDLKKWRWVLAFVLIICVALLALVGISVYSVLGFFILLFSPLLYIFLKDVERICLIKKVSPSFLTEGDWIDEDIIYCGKNIRNAVEGLTSEQIKYLVKRKKKVVVKYGIPFAFAFLLTLIFMVFFYAFLLQSPEKILSLLS